MQVKRFKRDIQTLTCFVSIICFRNDHYIKIALLTFWCSDFDLNSRLFYLISLDSKSRQKSIRIASTRADLIYGTDVVFYTDYIDILHALQD